MLLTALGSARATMTAGTGLLDRGADRIARATSSAVSSTVSSTTGLSTVSSTALSAAPAPPGEAPPDPGGQLVDGMLDLVLSRSLVAAGATTARRADEAYRSVLGLLDR